MRLLISIFAIQIPKKNYFENYVLLNPLFAFPAYIRIAYTPLNINICIYRVMYSLRLYYIYDMHIYMLNVVKVYCC